MKILGRILAVLVIVISVLSMLLALVSIVSVWRYSGPLIITLTEIASIAEVSLETADAALEVVDPVLSLLQGGMQDVQNNAEQLKADLESGDPLVDTLSALVGQDLKPKVEKARAKLISIHESLQTLNLALEAVNSLPFVDIPDITQASKDLVALFDDIAAGMDRLETGINDLKTGITEGVIQPIQDQAVQAEDDLAQVQIDVQELHSQVKTAYQVTVEVKPRIPQIVNGLALLLTLQLVWSLIAQMALIYIAWIYLKYGRMDVHKVQLDPVGNA